METLGHITSEFDRLNLAALVREIDARHVVEVGCYVGMTTRTLADSKSDLTIHAVDHFEGCQHDVSKDWYEEHGKEKVQRTFCENLSDVLFERVFLHVGTSEFYASIWPFSVDLVFIDASHEYEDVKKDIQAWMPHVRSGGILCGHDYGYFEGVTQAALEIQPVEVNGSLWKKQM